VRWPRTWRLTISLAERRMPIEEQSIQVADLMALLGRLKS
jgi:hypothetical protein